MSKKNSNVILKNNFKSYEELSHIYSAFKKKLDCFKTKSMFINLEYEQLTNEKGDAILQALTEKGEQDFLYLDS